MKRKFTFIFVTLLFIVACGNSETNETGKTEVLSKEWDEIVSSSNGTEVNLFMWGGDEGINQYIDEWAAPRLKEEHDITLNRQPMNTEEFMQKLLTEKKANKKEGTIDVIWINGANFKNAKNADLLLGSFSKKLPHFQEYIGSKDQNAEYDQGTKIDGLEAPWGNVQYVFHYDSSKIDTPPSTLEELKQWIHDNPGKFTYPNVSDFTGNTFVKHLLIKGAGEESGLLAEEFNKEIIKDSEEYVWNYLDDIKSDLWRNGETYPESLNKLDTLYSQGEILMTMGFNEARAESLIENGTFPESTKSFVLKDPGSVSNTHYLSIPFNSPNPEGAMTVIDFLESPEAQIAKMDPMMWGEGTVLNFDKLSEEDQKIIGNLDRGESVLSTEVLNEYKLPDLDTGYTEWINNEWANQVIEQ
ncbi:ABC transporter substrate-binding protein [Guptibacillus hwajinpoensis]|uniref:ABC transporter substrate-binding protein n=1 Tax=Guptibacillus hwajinpoensis TaxID=208199 RepID=UPI001CFCCBBA|nr:ABC transporter substrate-binding protein [Pseudalkalibacillus hwajinpoensis]WLR60377.1 ABC transporter substrate-binding protein [Pseudalkalibacillus hwajinpoensis]